MPLSEGKSKSARQVNIEKEIAAGKDPKQAVAIGYAKQRENKKKDATDAIKNLKGLINKFDKKK
jgi:hypothetical protein